MPALAREPANMAELWGIVIAGWFCSAIVGGIIGSGRNSAGAGFVLGLLFGPIGAIAAFALDGRVRCPQCANHIDTDVLMCPTCRAELGWLNGTVGTKDQIDRWAIRQQQERAAAARVEREQAEEAARRQEEWGRLLGVAAAGLWAAILATLRAGVLAPIAAIDRWLHAMSDGSSSIYRVLQVIWYVLMPLVVASGLFMVSSLSQPQPPPVVEPPRQEAPVEMEADDPLPEVAPAVVEAPPPRAEMAPVIPDVAVQEEVVPPQPDPFAGRDERARVDDHAQAPVPPAEAAPRPAVVDGEEIAAREALAVARAERKRRIAQIEVEIELLSRERRSLVQQGDADRADQLLARMRSLRAEMNNLKREIARDRRQGVAGD